VPGFNDTPEEIRAISRIAASLHGVREHHLLPYHRLGQDKYAGLDRKYELTEILPPDDEKMHKLLTVAKKYFKNSVIGG
jgi:pyruvate formate lyase activating enzyme